MWIGFVGAGDPQGVERSIQKKENTTMELCLFFVLFVCLFTLLHYSNYVRELVSDAQEPMQTPAASPFPQTQRNLSFCLTGDLKAQTLANWQFLAPCSLDTTSLFRLSVHPAAPFMYYFFHTDGGLFSHAEGGADWGCIVAYHLMQPNCETNEAAHNNKKYIYKT